MNETIKTPTPAELRKAGYKVAITHLRSYKMAYNDFVTHKIVVKTGINPVKVLRESCIDSSSDGVLYEILPKGGMTEVTVKDPVNNLDFTATATCRDDENYDKKIGVGKCLDRIIGLMLVCEYQDKTFKVRVGT